MTSRSTRPSPTASPTSFRPAAPRLPPRTSSIVAAGLAIGVGFLDRRGDGLAQVPGRGRDQVLGTRRGQFHLRRAQARLEALQVDRRAEGQRPPDPTLFQRLADQAAGLAEELVAVVVEPVAVFVLAGGAAAAAARVAAAVADLALAPVEARHL
jgi:hypothetical protein